MGRPDKGLVARQHRDIASYVGETGTWRRILTQETTTVYGGGTDATYFQRIATALLSPITPEEIQAAGGQYLAGDMRATFVDVNVQRGDEYLWSGVVWRVESDPYPQAIGDRAHGHVLLRRGL